MHDMLADVALQAKKMIVSEYGIHVARQHDPRLNADLLACESAGLAAAKAIKYHLSDVLVGAEIAGRYRLEAYIMSGSYGHGWRAVDMHSGEEVFVKTFKSRQEFPRHTNAVVSAMIEELETAERISKVEALVNHPNIVAVLKVPRGASIHIPLCGKQVWGGHVWPLHCLVPCVYLALWPSPPLYLVDERFWFGLP